MRTIRFYFRLLTAFVKKRKKIVIVGMLSGFVCFFSIIKVFDSLASQRVVKIGLVGRYGFEQLPKDILELASRGLTRIDDKGIPVPDLAEKWEINQDNKEYLITLKDDLIWQDGTKMSSSDIDFNFSDVAVNPIDNNHLLFKLREPYSPFLSIISRPIFKNGIIGIGDYRIKSFKKQGDIIEELTLISKIRKPSKLIYRFYPTEESARTAFKLGKIDLLEKFSDPGDLEKWPNINISTQVDFSRYSALFLNSQDPLLKEKMIRQSLAYSIEKPWKERAINSYQPKTWAYNANVKPYEYDPTNSKNLWEKSFPEEGNLSPSEIEIQTIPSLLDLAEQIGKSWEKNLNIKSKVKVIISMPENFQTLLIYQEIPTDPDQYSLWHSKQSTNISQLKNPKIDKLLEDGRQTMDLEKRKEIYFDFQRFLLEESPAVFLFHPTTYTIERK